MLSHTHGTHAFFTPVIAFPHYSDKNEYWNFVAAHSRSIMFNLYLCAMMTVIQTIDGGQKMYSLGGPT